MLQGTGVERPNDLFKNGFFFFFFSFPPRGFRRISGAHDLLTILRKQGWCREVISIGSRHIYIVGLTTLRKDFRTQQSQFSSAHSNSKGRFKITKSDAMYPAYDPSQEKKEKEIQPPRL